MALKPPIVTGDCWAVMRYVCAYCGREAALAELEHSCPGCAAKRWEEFTGKKAVLDGNEGHTQSS